MRDQTHTKQLSLSSVCPHPSWGSALPPKPSVEAPPLSANVRRQTHEFERAAVEHGLLTKGSARTYRKALECVVKQAGRLRGHPLEDMRDLYDEDLLAEIFRDDRPFDGSTPRLSRYTLRQRRGGPLGKYLQVIGFPDLTLTEGLALRRRACRRAAVRRGDGYMIAAGRPEQLDRYRPPIDDVKKFFNLASSFGHSFTGPRLAAAAALTLWHGLRPVSLLAIDGTDFRWHLGSLFLVYRDKRSGNKPPLKEIQVRPEAADYLETYVRTFNSCMMRFGLPERVGFGASGPLFRGTRGRRWRYDSLRAAYAANIAAAGIPTFSAYGLRHLYGSGMASLVPVGEAAVGGGWANDRVFLRHYARSLRLWEPIEPTSEPRVDLDGDRPDRSDNDRREQEVFSGDRRLE